MQIQLARVELPVFLFRWRLIAEFQPVVGMSEQVSKIREGTKAQRTRQVHSKHVSYYMFFYFEELKNSLSRFHICSLFTGFYSHINYYVGLEKLSQLDFFSFPSVQGFCKT